LSSEPPRSQRWEYDWFLWISHLTGENWQDLRTHLAQRGDEGWELVSAVTVPLAGDPETITFFFKRPC